MSHPSSSNPSAGTLSFLVQATRSRHLPSTASHSRRAAECGTKLRRAGRHARRDRRLLQPERSQLREERAAGATGKAAAALSCTSRRARAACRRPGTSRARAWRVVVARRYPPGRARVRDNRRVRDRCRCQERSRQGILRALRLHRLCRGAAPSVPSPSKPSRSLSCSSGKPYPRRRCPIASRRIRMSSCRQPGVVSGETTPG